MTGQEDVRLARALVVRARALMYDHAHGLHEDHYDPTVGCTYPGCEDAFYLIARLEEEKSSP